MLFNSYAFMLVYVPVVLIGFVMLTRTGMNRAAVAFLSLASLAFYAYWDYRYVTLLLASILFNYVVGRAITRSPSDARSRRALLVLGLAGDLALLGFFKYAGFFVQTLEGATGAGLTVPQIVLPLGISFFTFTQIEYLVDAFRGNAEEYGLIEYSLFVTFFPHLIAGPILCHSDVIPQFRNAEKLRWVDESFALGFAFFALGLFKKTGIADNLSSWVGVVFSQPGDLSVIDSWAGALAYTFQLYFDFSGYSDMAVGLALMVGVTIPFNFDSPYKSQSIAEFWRRWHMTLSNFLRDYLYFPLGGSRCGSWRRTSNLMITMLLGGLWHGAGWTYVVWGGWHGALLSLNHWWRKRAGAAMAPWAGWLLTFTATVLGWVVFRAASLPDARTYLSAMFGGNGVALPPAFESRLGWLTEFGVRFTDLAALPVAPSGAAKLIGLGVLTAVVVLAPNTQEIVSRMTPRPRWLVFIGVVFCAAFLMSGGVSEFLYFQF